MVAEVLPIARRRTLVLFSQCAWCGGIKLSGHYVRIPGLGKVSGQLTVKLPIVPKLQLGLSHGICPSCADRVTEWAMSSRRSSAL